MESIEQLGNVYAIVETFVMLQLKICAEEILHLVDVLLKKTEENH
jgi:hypothetical protein